MSSKFYVRTLFLQSVGGTKSDSSDFDSFDDALIEAQRIVNEGIVVSDERTGDVDVFPTSSIRKCVIKERVVEEGKIPYDIDVPADDLDEENQADEEVTVTSDADTDS